MKVNIVALKRVHIGQNQFDRPPHGSEGRREHYFYRCDAKMAGVLIQNGLFAPAEACDAHALRAFGVQADPFYKAPEKPFEAPFVAPSKREVVEAALKDGKKQALSDATELVGLQMASTARALARNLEVWLKTQAD